MNGFTFYARLCIVCGICFFFLRGKIEYATICAWVFLWLTFIILLLGGIDTAKRANGETDE